MWSGNAQHPGGSYPTQWALNPAAYVNMPNEQVDWATLAQQWIKMKESMPEEGNVTEVENVNSAAVVQTSVAPSTVSEDTSSQTAVPNWQSTTGEGWWNNQQQQQQPPQQQPQSWEGNWNWQENNKLPVAPYHSTVQTYQEPAPTTPAYSSYQHSTNSHQQNHYSNSSNQQSYWSGGQSGSTKEWTGSSSHRNSKRSNHHQAEPAPQSAPEIDAVKRKQLPAWIREGLEKMEREKLKKVETERYSKEVVEIQPTNTRLGVNGSPEVPEKSKFESESDSEVPEVRTAARSPSPAREPSPPPLPKTKEEIFQAVMVGVRRILTQLLMEVTTEEVKKIADHVSRKYKRKAPASTVHKTLALTSLTGKLGLGIYETDSDDSNEDSPDEESEQDIKARIKRRQEEFENREIEIEKEIEEQEEREKRVLAGSRESSAEPTLPQVPSLQSGKGNEEEERRTLEKRSEERERREEVGSRQGRVRSRDHRRGGSSYSSSDSSSGERSRHRRHSRHHSRRHHRSSRRRRRSSSSDSASYRPSRRHRR